MRIVLNPKYKHLEEYLKKVDEHFEQEGREIHRGRNILRVLQVEGLTLVVKRYGRMPLTNRIATRLYKNSKAKNAYVRPLLLKERGFESPEPVAFVTYRESWLNATHYFVCLHSNYRYTMADLETLDADFRTEVIEAFARYAANLHKNGFLQRDFSAGNILFDRVGNRLNFALIDTNSMKCGRAVSVEKGCQNFVRLQGSPDFFEHLGALYAQHRNADPAYCISLIKKARHDYLVRKGQA